MSYIVNLLKKEYLNKIYSPRDLIYKTKDIDRHNIVESYIKNAQIGKTFRIKDLTYNKNPILFNASFGSREMQHIFHLYKLSTFSVNKGRKGGDWLVTEVQNSLWIEGVKSSKKKIKQVIKKSYRDDPEYYSKIIKNYNSALEFIMTTNDINEKNLFTLYGLLSKDINMGENELDGYPYRAGDVEIGSPDVLGSNPDLIKTQMDNLLLYVNNGIEEDFKGKDKDILPILAHYMFEIIHPYYDMNGRMGRLFALWIAKKIGISGYLMFLSESINKFKVDLYYKAFEVSSIDNFKNDPTFFVASVLTAIIANNITIAVATTIEWEVEKTHKEAISEFERDIIKSLLAKEINKTYQTEKFILGLDEMNASQVSKALRKLVRLGVIIEVNTKPKKYSINWTEQIKKQIDVLFKPQETN